MKRGKQRQRERKKIYCYDSYKCIRCDRRLLEYHGCRTQLTQIHKRRKSVVCTRDDKSTGFRVYSYVNAVVIRRRRRRRWMFRSLRCVCILFALLLLYSGPNIG